jgi:Spy/CpxP family protein refolding chaperone
MKRPSVKLVVAATQTMELTMRKLLFVLLLAAFTAACGEDTSAPAADTVLLDDAALLAFGSMDMADPGSRFIARLNSLPDSIKLTADQQTRIRELITAFVTATRVDMEALAAIHQEARAARTAGKTEAEIRAILARGDAIRARLHAAEAKLHADVQAVLTPAQKAWLANSGDRPRHHCSAEGIRLTDAQKTQITGLIAAFETANAADLQTIRAIHAEARAAIQAGASREQVAQILARANPAMQRVRAAREALNAAIRAVLTPAQVASGCFGDRG